MKRIGVIVLLLSFVTSFGQESPYYKFGKITAADLQRKVYSVDSSASAVILSDIGDCAIEGNMKSWFSVTFKHHRVAHILNKNGYSIADVEIPVWVDGSDEEKLNSIKAVTYTLDNGKVVETKLDKSSIFKDKRNKNLTILKFTMPNVKEGCIIEYEYELTSDYISYLKSWAFQGTAPRIWSEYKLRLPEFMNYVTIAQGYLPFFIRDQKESNSRYTVSETRGTGSSESLAFNANVTDYRWVMKDVPELKRESFTSTLENHIAKLEFQLSGTRQPLQYSDRMGSWSDLTKRLLQAEWFGSSLNSGNGWLGDDMKQIIGNATNEEEKARKIYSFVRDNFTCTDHDAIVMEQSLKNVLKTRKGNVSEINLLLTAMLRYAKITADPVILSTRDNGVANPIYPLLKRFNYVVVQAKTGNKTIYLDASEPRMGFGKLPSQVYNGHARVVNEIATPIAFQPDSISETGLTSMFISNSDKGNWVGTFNQTPGYYRSAELREKVIKKGKEELTAAIKKDYGSEITISNTEIDSVKQFDVPVKLHYDVDFPKQQEEILYVNPMFGEATKKNPFASAQRFYPVEMPYAIDDTYVLTMEVPNGYVVDELPKQMRLALDDKNSGSFDYLISSSGNTISMRTRLKINRTYFEPDEYEMLREFFNIVVKKQNEQVVFKKKK